MTNTIDQLLLFLCPPGSGVYTVSAGALRRRAIEEQLYGTYGEQAIHTWQEQLKDIANNPQPFLLLGVPSDTGGSIQRGANWGPLFVRQYFYQHNKQAPIFDLGDIRTIPQLLLDEYCSDTILNQTREYLYGDQHSDYPVSPLSLAKQVTNILHQQFPEKTIISLGGDHSVSYPLVEQFLLAKKQQNKRCAIIHFDAHTDLLDSRMGIPICFGSWVFPILPLLKQPQDLIQIGLRSSAHDKSYWQDLYGVQQYWLADIKKQGMQSIIDSIIAYLSENQIDQLYITFDIDALDSEIASATGTPEKDGLSLEDALNCIEQLVEAVPLAGADLVEVAPYVGRSDKEPQSTLDCASQIIAAMMQIK